MALSLDASALTALNHLRATSTCVEPVAGFSKRSNVFRATAALRDAIASNEEQKLRDVAEQEWAQTSANIEFFLDVFMYEKSQVEGRDIVLADGVDFEVPPFLSPHLAEACLFYEGDFFVLRNRDGTIVHLPF